MRPIFELLEIPISNETTSLFESEQVFNITALYNLGNGGKLGNQF